MSVSAPSMPPTRPPRWRAWAIALGIVAAVVWLAVAYVQNRTGIFYAGLLVLLLLLVGSHWWLRLPSLAVQVVNTAILVVVGLPLADGMLALTRRDGGVPPLSARPYAFDVAQKDPAAFGRWWAYNRAQFEGLLKQIVVPDADSALRLRPGATANFFDATIAINAHGFRGADIPPKGDAYRIVTLGESTTFGLTMGEDDRPWPELLATLIRERLHPPRPVQVINAGIPGITLESNLVRLARDVLPLQPDMVISYHGYNGFSFIIGGMPAIHGKPAPPYQPRPIRLLADLEYQLAMRRYREQLAARDVAQPVFPADPMQSKYARLYRELIRLARAHGVTLVLATYSMAVDADSPPDVAEFFRTLHLELDWQVRANAAHNAIVRELARENDLVLVDTQPALDGQWQHYYDLVHFTESGERLMAEAFYTGIAPTLQMALSSPATR